MPRFNIIILNRPEQDNNNVYRYAMWADVPGSRWPFYANSGGKSQWKDASSADIAAIMSGSVIETVETINVAPGTGIVAVESFLETRWNNFQADISAFNPFQRYGSTWNGSQWVAGGVS